MMRKNDNKQIEDDQPTFTFDDRHWRVRGLDKQLSCERMRVNLLVTRRDLIHVDSLDLYASRSRRTFVREVAAELFVEEAQIKQDLGHVLLRLEALQNERIRARVARQTPQAAAPVMSQAEQQDARTLLEDPELIGRIDTDLDACGLVGEQANRLVCYLVCVSRLLPRPLSVLIQSSSGAGKTTLQDAVLRLMPADETVRLSALTAQSLYYMGADALRHKVLAIAEEEGLAQAAYALKLLQSEGRLSIATAGRNSDTGRQQTELYEVEGPVAMLLTTTAEQPDAELANRCITLRTNEQPQQTAAIHVRQRERYGRRPAAASCQAIVRRHQNAQRLLEPLGVVIPWAERLTFRNDQLHTRRDNAKYLALIASIALLHQRQRKQTSRSVDGGKQACVIATLADVELANRLAVATLAPAHDCLLPRARRLLDLLGQYVARQAKEQSLPPNAVRFTQRDVREALRWNDRTLRRHLMRLVELEYVLVHRTGRGNGRVYQLACAAPGGTDAASLLGLIDLRQLGRRKRPRPGQKPIAQTSDSDTRARPQAGDSDKTASEPAPIRHPSGTLQKRP